MIQMNGFDVEKIRKDFPILSTKRNGYQLAYLDSAATSQKPNQVIDTVNYYYKNYNANIHRGMYEISVKATEAYTRSKELCAKFINAKSYRNIIYVKNVSEALNLVALSWGDANIKQGDTILTTQLEHHSNIVPWQLLAKRKKAKLEYVELTDSLFIDMEDYKQKLEHNPKIVTFAHISNVSGTIHNAKEMTRLAHDKGATVVIDAAQSVPHMPINVQEINADFLGFSSHKMLGPSGIGILYGKEELLDEMEPIFGGGDMIRTVDFDGSTWNELPWKFEVGTPNIEGGIGFGAAIEYLNNIGLENIRKHEVELTEYALEKLENVKGVDIYGPKLDEINGKNKAGVISFNVNGVHGHDVATIFDSVGIAVRAGHHCAMPLVTKIIGEPSVVRMSVYLYNKEDEIDRMVKAIDKVREVLKIKQ